VKVVERL
jgi:hypothetical protein